MKRRLLLFAAAGLLTLGGAFGTMAAQPNHPGCFGRDRAAWIHDYSGNAWAQHAKARAGDNGTINNDYKTYCQSLP